MKNLKRINVTEKYEFINLKNLFLNNPLLISKEYNKYILYNNSETPSETKNFMLNADAIFKSNYAPIIYVQNSSFENNFYVQKKLSKEKGNFKSIIKTIIIGKKLEGKDLIMSLINSLNKIFKKKSNYSNFPNNKDAFAYLYLTCDSLLEFMDNSLELLTTLLSQTLNYYIQENNLKNYYKKILITFNPVQVNANLEIDHIKSHAEINEKTRDIELDLSTITKNTNDLIANIKNKIKMHEYFFKK